MPSAAAAPFRFSDGERLIRFGSGALAEAPALLAERGFDGYALLTTERAEGQAPAIVRDAAVVAHVPHGQVPDAAAAVRADAAGRPLVALGGGRVVDVAKAIGAADGQEVAAVPTTLAGSAWTPFHRPLPGEGRYGMLRPSLVVGDPALMASQPEAHLTATAMNALAHACESLYAPGHNPVATGAALRAARLFREGLVPGDPDRAAVALAGLLGGYAIGTTGFSVHHAVSQSIVRAAGTPHAETNAVMLPHSLRFVAGYHPEPLAELARALGRDGSDPLQAADAVAELAARTGATRLADLGIGDADLDGLVEAAGRHPVLSGPNAPTRDELDGLLRAAL